MAQQITDQFDTDPPVEEPHRERVAKVVGTAAIKGQSALASVLLVKVANCRVLDRAFWRTRPEE
jgi:hypothetical protein